MFLLRMLFPVVTPNFWTDVVRRILYHLRVRGRELILRENH